MTTIQRTINEIKKLTNEFNIKTMELRTIEEALTIEQTLLSKYPKELMNIVVNFRESHPEYSKDDYDCVDADISKDEKRRLFKWRSKLSRLNKRYSTLIVQCIQFPIYHNYEDADVELTHFGKGVCIFHFSTRDQWEDFPWNVGTINIPLEALEDDFKGFKEFLKLIEDSKIVVNFAEETCPF